MSDKATFTWAESLNHVIQLKYDKRQVQRIGVRLQKPACVPDGQISTPHVQQLQTRGHLWRRCSEMCLNINAHLRQRLGTVSLGGHADVLAKETAEVSVVLKTEFGGQLFDGQSGVNQFALRFLN